MKVCQTKADFGIAVPFACILKGVPAARVDWRDVRRSRGYRAPVYDRKWALGVYLGKSSSGSAFGAAGSVVVLVV